MDTRALSVLVIDNEPDVLKSVQLALRSSGFRLTLTSDPTKALELARTVQPDVILCDAVMPDLSGPRVIALLKSEAATARIPVVLMTAVPEAYMFSHASWTGYLSKPFSPRELRDVIESAVKNALPVQAKPGA